MHYLPKYFSIEELVPPEVYADRGEKAWQLLDPKMLMTIDQMREAFGPMVINTWHSKKLMGAYGVRKYSGLRTLEFYENYYPGMGMEQYFNSYSQHKYGRAFDAVFKERTAAEVREYVRNNLEEFPYLTAIECGISWFHGDVRNVKPLMEFYP